MSHIVLDRVYSNGEGRELLRARLPDERHDGLEDVVWNLRRHDDGGECEQCLKER